MPAWPNHRRRSSTNRTRAGGGGALRTLFWQAPTSLNPHFAVGGAGIFYEPLTSWDPDGNLVPMPPPDRGTEGFPCRFYNIDRSGLRFAAVTDMPSAATPPFSMFGISAASSVSVAVAPGVSEVRIGLAAGGKWIRTLSPARTATASKRLLSLR
jgi:hypothetical protein